MQNYKKIPINFNCSDIFDILRIYPLPRNDLITVDACSSEVIKEVSKILNLNLPIISIIYFRVGGLIKGPIHIDKNLNKPNSGQIKHALNIPLIHCNDLYMRWYEQIHSTTNSESMGGVSNGCPIPHLNYNNARHIDEVNCNQVNLVNILDWHSIETRSAGECSHLISVRFEPHIKPSFDKPLHEW